MLIDILKVFIISMVPVVELRGALPYALHLGVPLSIAFPVAILGNMVPVPFILLLFDKCKVWFRNVPVIGAIFAWVDKRASGKAEKVRKMEFWGILSFVAIPLPGTGAWTGSVIACVLGMKCRKAIPAVICGVLVAGLLVSLLSYGLWDSIVALF